MISPNQSECIFAAVVLSVGMIISGCAGQYNSDTATPSPSPSESMASSIVKLNNSNTGFTATGPTTGGFCPNSYDIEFVLHVTEAGKERGLTAREVYAESRNINIKIAEVFQNDEELHGYGFFTNITTDNLIDKYGNATTDPILSICYTADDIEQMNLPAMESGSADILKAGMVWDDQVSRIFK